MKRAYEKPQVYVENFVMDMDIAADQETEYIKALRNAFAAIPVSQRDFDGDGVYNEEADWNAYLSKMGYDNSTSGFCYHGFVGPS